MGSRYHAELMAIGLQPLNMVTFVAKHGRLAVKPQGFLLI